MKLTLQELETQLERWIEGSIIRLLGTQIPAASLASQLAQAMQNGLRTGTQGTIHAPENYRVMLNPETFNQYKHSASELSHQLGSGLFSIANDQGYFIAKEPEIVFIPDPAIARWDIEVTAWHSTSPLDQTDEMVIQTGNEPPPFPEGAFLIINGDRHFPLDQPVINIGRRQDNQLVLDSPLVSRTHAQIRVRHGRFMLFDLGSKSGTQVQGITINQHILQPGDVITIADVQLVYGEELKPMMDETLGFTPIPPHI
jgi:hypothetical protein